MFSFLFSKSRLVKLPSRSKTLIQRYSYELKMKYNLGISFWQMIWLKNKQFCKIFTPTIPISRHDRLCCFSYNNVVENEAHFVYRSVFSTTALAMSSFRYLKCSTRDSQVFLPSWTIKNVDINLYSCRLLHSTTPILVFSVTYTICRRLKLTT